MPLVGKLKFFADCKLKLAANRRKVSGVCVCVCARRVERATGRMRYMQITYTQCVSCVCVRTQTTDDSRMSVRVCVYFIYAPKAQTQYPFNYLGPVH